MPAFKTTLRFLALGTCADVATSFGTFIHKDDLGVEVAVYAESSTPPVSESCACAGMWECRISDVSGSLSYNPSNLLNSVTLAQYASYCWNTCFKMPEYLVAEYWEPDDNGECEACSDYVSTYDFDGACSWYHPSMGEAMKMQCPSYPHMIDVGPSGCQCGTKATDYDDCAGEEARNAKAWRDTMCGQYSPAYAAATDNTIEDELYRAPRGNPFRDSNDWIDGLSTVGQGGGWVVKICNAFNGATFCPDGAGDQATRCAPIVAEGSQNIGDSTCEEAGPAGTDKDCNLLYSYTDNGLAPRTATYCDQGQATHSGYSPIGLDAPADCELLDQATCTTQWSAPSYYAAGEPFGADGVYASQRYVYCKWTPNGCKPNWQVNYDSPFTGEPMCLTPNEPCDTEVGVCKALLCTGDPADDSIPAVRPDDPACSGFDP